jgi:hypothetical protein
METTAFLAQMLGIISVVLGMAMLFNLEWTLKVFKDFLKSPALIYLTGLAMFVLGLCLVFVHSVWIGTWQEIVVTIAAWLVMIKGLFYLLMPEFMVEAAKDMITESWMLFAAIIELILGVYLIAAAFVM